MITECANCYSVAECLDDGEAYICTDRVACQERAMARAVDREECLTCDGRGGTLSYDSDGDGAWAMTYETLDPCPDCIGSGKCPGCGAPMTPEQQTAAERDIESFTCTIDACSWHYDADRFYASDEPDWGDYGW